MSYKDETGMFDIIQPTAAQDLFSDCSELSLKTAFTRESIHSPTHPPTKKLLTPNTELNININYNFFFTYFPFFKIFASLCFFH
jgi:hypothetical protein